MGIRRSVSECRSTLAYELLYVIVQMYLREGYSLLVLALRSGYYDP